MTNVMKISMSRYLGKEIPLTEFLQHENYDFTVKYDLLHKGYLLETARFNIYLCLKLLFGGQNKIGIQSQCFSVAAV